MVMQRDGPQAVGRDLFEPPVGPFISQVVGLVSMVGEHAVV